MADFIAKHRINAPGSYAGAYQAGDPVAADVVANWELVIGDEVEPADGYRAPRPAEDSTDRAGWEAYVTARGTGLDEARAASLEDLRAMHEPDPEPEQPAHDLPANASAEGVDGAGVQNPTPVTAENTPAPNAAPADSPQGAGDGEVERPNQSARKAEWQDYVIALGGNADWVRADDTTKDDLIAWKPQG